jgi:hypothetical protein
MSYVTRWRMHLAAAALRGGGTTVAALAERLAGRWRPSRPTALSKVSSRPYGMARTAAASMPATTTSLITRSCPSNTRVASRRASPLRPSPAISSARRNCSAPHGCIEGDGKVLDLFDFRTGRRELVLPTIDVPKGLEGHGGGDAELVRAFLDALVSGDPAAHLPDPRQALAARRTTSPGPPNKLGSPPRSSTLLAAVVPEWGYRPAARRAASSICAVPKTRTIAATVAVSFAGSVTVGCCGHLISIASGVSGRWTSSTTSRSDLLTAPTASNRSESLDAELAAGPELATRLVFHRYERFVLRCRQDHKISRNCARPR